MIRVVLDTNVLVSAMIKVQGAEAAAVDVITSHYAEMVVSRPILAEYAEVLARPELRSIPFGFNGCKNSSGAKP